MRRSQVRHAERSEASGPLVSGAGSARARLFASLRVTGGPDEVHRMVVARRILRAFKDGGVWEFE